MQDYVIITDSGTDLPDEMLKRLGIPSISLNCFMKDDPTAAVTLRGKAFYDELRAGKVACTSAANLSVFRETFSAFLKEGTDILYLSFSSALSCMCATAKLAAEELSEEFPERKIHVIDSRCASLGQGLLVYFSAEKKAHGATLDELAAYTEEMKSCMMHWFTVDDLLYLKRGGRLSTVSALAGTLLGIGKRVEPLPVAGNVGVVRQFRLNHEPQLVARLEELRRTRLRVDPSKCVFSPPSEDASAPHT